MNPFQAYQFFKGMRIPHLSLLMKCASEKTYESGEALFTEGEPVDHFVLVKLGVVTLFKQAVNNALGMKTARSGDVLGWSCLVPGSVWDWSGEALTRTTVTLLSAGHLNAAARDNPDFGSELSRRVAQQELGGAVTDPVTLKFQLIPLAAQTVLPSNTSSARRYSDVAEDALTLSDASAEGLSVHDGQWIQLIGRDRKVCLRVHVQPEIEQIHGSVGIVSHPRMRNRQLFVNETRAKP